MMFVIKETVCDVCHWLCVMLVIKEIVCDIYH